MSDKSATVVRVFGGVTYWPTCRSADVIPVALASARSTRCDRQAEVRLVLGVPKEQLTHPASRQPPRGYEVCDPPLTGSAPSRGDHRADRLPGSVCLLEDIHRGARHQRIGQKRKATGPFHYSFDVAQQLHYPGQSSTTRTGLLQDAAQDAAVRGSRRGHFTASELLDRRGIVFSPACQSAQLCI